jgi:hypothetical protein
MPRCPVCGGEGGESEDFGEGTVVFRPCGYCRETGRVGLFKWLSYQWRCGKFWRIAQRKERNA